MVTLQVRRVIYEDLEVDPTDVMTVKEASERLGLTLEGVISVITRNRLTELIDPDAVHQFRNRRFVLRSEVEEMAERRERAARKWEGKG